MGRKTMNNKLQKRDCDIKIKLTPSGAQFLHFEMDIQGDHLDFLPASTMGEQFGAVVSALYTLFHEDDDMHDEWRSRENLSDVNHVVHTRITKVDWDNEGDDIEIIMSRNGKIDIDFENDQIKIEIKRYDELLKTYNVKTKDLCYAVAKACTEVLKEYGIYGYRYSTEYDCFNLHQLLYIKSFALGNFEARELIAENELDWAKRTSFEKELELLLFDM